MLFFFFLVSSQDAGSSAFLKVMLLPLVYADECSVACIDTLLVGAKPMVALALSELPDHEGLILAMGGLDNKIHLYCREVSGKVSCL